MNPTTVPSIDVDAALAAASDSSALLLDVREAEEWMAGHAPGAVHLPMSEIVERVGELPRARTIVCVCRSGSRSARVAAWLGEQGYAVQNMAGGMTRWAGAGHPLINHADRPGVVI